MVNTRPVENTDIVRSLLGLYQQLVARSGNGPWDRKDPLVDQIRVAGRRLHECEGISSMRNATAALYHLTGGRYSTAVHFNELWDGVGHWRK